MQVWIVLQFHKYINVFVTHFTILIEFLMEDIGKRKGANHRKAACYKAQGFYLR
jgi:hypothetical protein